MSQPAIQVGSYVRPVQPGLGPGPRCIGTVLRLVMVSSDVAVRWSAELPGFGWVQRMPTKNLRLATQEELAKAQLTTLEGL